LVWVAGTQPARSTSVGSSHISYKTHRSGKTCHIFCDNDAVADVITYQKPKDACRQQYLREFLFWVCNFNLRPVVSKIGTKENDVADFLSRNFCQSDAALFFNKENLSPMSCLEINDDLFKLKAEW
jgi:hypothetical protein